MPRGRPRHWRTPLPAFSSVHESACQQFGLAPPPLTVRHRRSYPPPKAREAKSARRNCPLAPYLQSAHKPKTARAGPAGTGTGAFLCMRQPREGSNEAGACCCSRPKSQGPDRSAATPDTDRLLLLFLPWFSRLISFCPLVHSLPFSLHLPYFFYSRPVPTFSVPFFSLSSPFFLSFFFLLLSPLPLSLTHPHLALSSLHAPLHDVLLVFTNCIATFIFSFNGPFFLFLILFSILILFTHNSVAMAPSVIVVGGGCTY